MLFDPLRRKEVADTPEERVRQWFIALLRDSAAVPAGLMMSEWALEYGGKRYRADIVVFDREALPLAVVECKRPEVKIDASVAEQAMRYNIVLGVTFLFLTNGKNTYLYKREGDVFRAMDHLPSYEEMLQCRR